MGSTNISHWPANSLHTPEDFVPVISLLFVDPLHVALISAKAKNLSTTSSMLRLPLGLSKRGVRHGCRSDCG